FVITAPPTTQIYTLSLHDALPISPGDLRRRHRLPALDDRGLADPRVGDADDELGAHPLRPPVPRVLGQLRPGQRKRKPARLRGEDRKSTRLNSSHDQISYAVFCLK